MVNTLAEDMTRTNQIASEIVNGELSSVFALNANFAEYSLENGFRTDFGFTLYSEDVVKKLVKENPQLLPSPSVDIPADMRWNKQKISSVITQSVLQGSSIPEIAKAMQAVVGMNKASAVRNARTSMTSAQNAGRQEVYDRAKAMGIKVKKEWMATLDGRTRHSHGAADGQQVELDGMFAVGGDKMRYPGDIQNGTAKEIYNCRCTMVTREPAAIMQGEKPRMTYQEWHSSKESAENSLKSGGKGGIIKENDILIGRSLGAKAKNYDVYNPKSGEIINLVEGTHITKPKDSIIAGKGRNRKIDELDFLVNKFGGNPDEWQKVKGFGFVYDEYGEERKVELHWYQEPTVGIVKMKIKERNGEIYIDED